MPHPSCHNHLRYVFESLYVADRDSRPILTTLVKGTFDVGASPVIAALQQALCHAGQHYGPPDTSSYRYEPETAYTKPSTDVVLIGHAHPTQRQQKHIDVRLQVGPVQKTVRVLGDRTWVKRLGIVDMTNPLPIEEPIPLIYERAFGGWDAATPDPMARNFEPRNPVGVGFKRKVFEEGLPVPNLEDPKKPLLLYGDTPPPAGFGFISPHWQPRAAYAGTYDAKWEKERSPLLPHDFDLRFFNAASPGLVAPKYLEGNEAVTVENATPDGKLTFQLPAKKPPQIRVRLRNGKDVLLDTHLDTVIINTDEMLLFLLWRNHLILRSGPHDVAEIIVGDAASTS